MPLHRISQDLGLSLNLDPEVVEFNYGGWRHAAPRGSPGQLPNLAAYSDIVQLLVVEVSNRTENVVIGHL